MKKLPRTIGNQIFSLKCGFGISYGIGQKYQPICVPILVLDLNQNTYFYSLVENTFWDLVWDYPIFKELGPYPSGGTLGMINFANTESHCITQVFNRFIEYLPYIMLFQTLILVFAEKFTFRIPRIAQRVERFYKNIVEESLFGKGKLA